MQTNNQINNHILISVLLFPLTNIVLFLFGYNVVEIECNSFLLVNKIVICLFVAIAEELFFRGLVLHELVFSYNWQPIRASLIASFIFGIVHLVNVNSYAIWGYAIVQSICAFAVSFSLCAIFNKTKSLLLCVIIHILINITSIGVECSVYGQKLLLNNVESIVFLSVSFIYLVTGIKMLNSEMVEGK